MAKKKNYDSWIYADLKHYKRTEEYNRQLKAILDGCTRQLQRLYDEDELRELSIKMKKDFSFSDYPKQDLQSRNYISQMVQSSVKLIEKAQKDSWLAATYKNDDFINSILDKTKLSKEELEKMSDRRLDAFAKFQKRKVNGMGLSERVWKLADGFKDQVELAIDVNIKRGARATKDLEKLVNLPQEMFQAIADIEDEDVRRKILADVRTGRGVYKSLQANAYRLMRTENNMAYRESDWQRWQNMDFVVGYTIHRTNNEDKFKCPLCDELAGDYPKQFKFVGWHPQCMCFVTPIIADDETLKENQLNRLRSAIRGVSNKVVKSKRTVEDVPDNFKKWIKDNTYRSARWKSQPYFIRDNFVGGQLSKGLNIALPTVKKATIELFKGSTPQEIKDFIIQNIAKSCTLEIKSSDIDLWNDIVNQLNNRIKQFGLEKFGNIGTPRSRNAEASWDEHGNILNLNITALRNKTAIKKAMSYKKRGILYSFAYEDSDDYVRAVIDHELGHLILSKYANVSEVAKLMGDVGKSIMVNGKSFNPINDILGYYASIEEHEFFAEAFSFYMGKNREKLDDRIKGYFERLFSKQGIEDCNANG